jgi:hypothetical protein
MTRDELDALITAAPDGEPLFDSIAAMERMFRSDAATEAPIRTSRHPGFRKHLVD